MAGNWQYQLIKALSRLVCLLPYQAVCRIGRGIGYLGYRIAVRQRNRGIEQAMLGLAITRPEADLLIHRLFTNLGMMLMEVLYTPALDAEKIRGLVAIDGLEHLRKAVAAGRGVILFTAHMGNWEWLGAALAFAGFPMTTLAKPQPNRHFTRLLNEYRAMVGLKVFNRGIADMFKAVRALMKGKVLGFIADQDGGREGVFVDFFGRKASTTLGPAILASKYGAAIVPAFIFRLADGRHQVVIDPPFCYEHSGNHEHDLYINTAKMTQLLEDRIRAHPEEWLWFKKRWNTPFASG